MSDKDTGENGTQLKKTTLILPMDLYRAVKRTMADRDIELQQVMAEAVGLWLAFRAVPEREQTLPCPHCESTLSVGTDSTGKLAVLDFVPPAEQTKLIQPQNAPISVEAKSWLDLVLRALRIRDAQWSRMLGNIKIQLAQVAQVADEEPEPEPGRGGGDLPQRPDVQGIIEARRSRSRTGGSTRSGRKKTG